MLGVRSSVFGFLSSCSLERSTFQRLRAPEPGGGRFSSRDRPSAGVGGVVNSLHAGAERFQRLGLAAAFAEDLFQGCERCVVQFFELGSAALQVGLAYLGCRQGRPAIMKADATSACTSGPKHSTSCLFSAASSSNGCRASEPLAN